MKTWKLSNIKFKMLAAVLSLIIFCLEVDSTKAKSPAELSELVYKDKIIPDVIPFPPVNVLKLQWGNVSADFGNYLQAHEVRLKPVCSWPHEKNGYYTLIYTAPDMPDPRNSTQREYKHWIVVDIPGVQVDKGQVLTDYIPPAIPHENGPQRYVFLIYIQYHGKIVFLDEAYIPPVANEVVREKFLTERFVEKYGLGNPTAANWFRINWESIERSEEDTSE